MQKSIEYIDEYMASFAALQTLVVGNKTVHLTVRARSELLV